MTRRQWALLVFELDEVATEIQIREAYRDLIAIWHPDKHNSNERVRQRAEEMTKKLNLARAILLGDECGGGWVEDTFAGSCPPEEDLSGDNTDSEGHGETDWNSQSARSRKKKGRLIATASWILAITASATLGFRAVFGSPSSYAWPWDTFSSGRQRSVAEKTPSERSIEPTGETSTKKQDTTQGGGLDAEDRLRLAAIVAQMEADGIHEDSIREYVEEFKRRNKVGAESSKYRVEHKSMKLEYETGHELSEMELESLATDLRVATKEASIEDEAKHSSGQSETGYEAKSIKWVAPSGRKYTMTWQDGLPPKRRDVVAGLREVFQEEAGMVELEAFVEEWSSDTEQGGQNYVRAATTVLARIRSEPNSEGLTYYRVPEGFKLLVRPLTSSVNDLERAGQGVSPFSDIPIVWFAVALPNGRTGYVLRKQVRLGN